MLLRSSSSVEWTEGDWLVWVDVNPLGGAAVSRTEMQRIIDGLVWP
jgi:hypothetical protein